MKKTSITLILLIVAFISTVLIIGGPKAVLWHILMKMQDEKIVFQGQVVDFDGNPVTDAVVVLSVKSYDPTDEFLMSSNEYRLKTDSNGLFLFKGRGRSLSIRNVIKEDYEFKLEYLDYYYFEYDMEIKSGNSGQNIPFDANSEIPFVFKIRQHSTVNFLLEKSFTWYFRKSKNKPFAPLLLGEWIDPYGKELNLNAYRYAKNKCLEISCEFNKDYSEFELLFKGVIEDSSVYLSDTLLFEAPIDGYQQEVNYGNTMVRTVSDGSVSRWYNEKLYLYVKGPVGKYYSRIELSVSTVPATQHRKDATVQVSGEIYTNPEGRRYLDYNETYNSNERIFRRELVKKRSKARKEARGNKQPFDEKAFKVTVDKKRV
ncbi:MAG: Ig-like domain-containing protein, partial [Planctomycetota bacterium]